MNPTLARLLATVFLGFAISPTRLLGADEPPVTVKPATPEGERSGGSEFLRPPGSGGSYGPAEEWASLPAWQRASFFGVRASGRVFIYVVDRSGSMADADRLIRAKREIRRSVADLRFPQRFQVIFYNDQPQSMPGGGIPTSADPAAKAQLLRWLDLVDAEGETDPRAALDRALGLRPDAVFLLSDGLFPDGTPEAIAARNPRKIPIHCIDLSGGSGEQLRQIARDSGAQYTAQP